MATFDTPTQNSNASSGTVTPGLTIAGLVVGDKIMVAVGGFPSTTMTCADNLGNTYTPVDSIQETGTTNTMQTFFCTVTVSGTATLVGSFSASVQNPFISALVAHSASVLDGHNAVQDSGSNPTPSLSATNTVQPTYAINLCWDLQGTGMAIGTGYTQIAKLTTAATQALIWERKNVTTTGIAVTGNFVNSGFDRNVTAMWLLNDGLPPPPAPSYPLSSMTYF